MRGWAQLVAQVGLAVKLIFHLLPAVNGIFCGVTGSPIPKMLQGSWDAASSPPHALTTLHSHGGIISNPHFLGSFWGFIFNSMEGILFCFLGETRWGDKRFMLLRGRAGQGRGPL